MLTFKYDAWGNFTASGSKSTDADFLQAVLFRYRGYIYDTDTGLYYLQTRYYDPMTGRFINADGQLNDSLIGYNLYAYCENNPVNRIDPIGEAWWHWAIGAGIVVGFAALTVVTAGGFAAGVSAVVAVGNGLTALTTASTVAASGFIASGSFLACAAIDASYDSESISEFMDRGNWGTVAGTAISGVVSSGVTYLGNKFSTPKSGSKLDKYVNSPSKLKNVSPGKIEKIAIKENLNVGTLSRGSHSGQGLKVTWGGDRLLQYHPGGGHHGLNSYWKVSSGTNETIRIFNDR